MCQYHAGNMVCKDGLSGASGGGRIFNKVRNVERPSGEDLVVYNCAAQPTQHPSSHHLLRGALKTRKALLGAIQLEKTTEEMKMKTSERCSNNTEKEGSSSNCSTN